MQRRKEIIKILKENDRITAKELSSILGVSDRTIRNDIKAINSLSRDNIILSSKKYGYSLTRAYKDKSGSLSKNSISETNRKSYILSRLINGKTSYTDLINKMYVSDATLNKLIGEINEDISPFNGLSIKRQKDNLFLNGSENDIRLMYKNLIYEESKSSFFNLNNIANYYNNFDLVHYKNLLEKIMQEYNYKIDEMSFPLLIMHLGITIERITSGNMVNNFLPDNKVKDEIEYQIASEFLEKIGKDYKIVIPESEKFLLAMIISSKRVSYDFVYEKDRGLEKSILDMLDFINEKSGIDFKKDKELVKNLYLHTKLLLNRLDKAQKKRNFYLNELRENYPYIFDLAVIGCNYLEGELDIQISEEEIAFYAIHFGTAYKKISLKKYKTIIIAAGDSNLVENLINKINSIFGDDLEINGVYSYFEKSQVLNKDIDLIIYTVPIISDLNIPMVPCSIFFNKEDEAKIFEAIKKLGQLRLKKNFTDRIKRLIKGDHFYSGLEFSDKNQVIQFLCDRIYEKGEVGADFYEKVIERESYSSTSFIQGFAIPHSINPENIKKSSISILTLKNPIAWDSYKVNLVFLLAIKKEDLQDLDFFYSRVDNIVTNASLFSKLIKSKDFNTFMRLFSKDEIYF